MAQKRETVFREKVRADLKSVYRCHPFPIQQKSIVGTPDFLLCVNGWFVGLELKADDASPISALQKYNLQKIEEFGGISFVAHPENWKNILAKLQKLGVENA